MAHAPLANAGPTAARPGRGRAALGALCAAAALCCSSKPSPTAEATRPRPPPDAEAAKSAPPGAGREPFRVATFNAGLAVGYLPYAEERAPLVINALAAAQVDLLCVQEFWLEGHWQALKSAASSRLPHAHRLPPAAGAAAAACSRAEAAPLFACAREHCGALGASGLGGCVLQHCAGEARGLSPGCINCLIGNPVGALESIVAACSAPDAPPPPAGRGPTAPRRGAEIVAYGGSFGTGILSREPLLETDALVFDATLNPRAALYARLRPASLGELHVVCTHLTPPLSAPLGGRPPAAQQREQIERLLPWVEQKVRGGGAVVLMGDLNAGPRVGAAVEAVQPDHYAKLIAARFQNPYASRPDARCTFCASNPLNGGAGARGALIDHILLRGHAGGVKVEPFLRDSIGLEAGGARLQSAYSDHYGLAATLTPAGT